jgi:hypothetical protein
VLDGISFSVRRGESLGVLGRNHDPDKFQERFESVLLDLVEQRAEAAA